MATGDADAETAHPLDFRLVHNTFVTMFWQPSLLDETVEWLRAHGYEVMEFNAGSWASTADMYDDIALGLNFPDYFGRNLAGPRPLQTTSGRCLVGPILAIALAALLLCSCGSNGANCFDLTKPAHQYIGKTMTAAQVLAHKSNQNLFLVSRDGHCLVTQAIGLTNMVEIAVDNGVITAAFQEG